MSSILTRLTRNIDEQNQLQRPRILLSPLLRRRNSLIDQPTLTADTQWVQHIESIVSQPRYESRLVSAEGEHEERVPDHLRDTPRNQHARIPRALSQERELVDNTPDEQESGRDLHSSCRNRSSHDTYFDKCKLIGHTPNPFPTDAQKNAEPCGSRHPP
jgi:hypothetical protein